MKRTTCWIGLLCATVAAVGAGAGTARADGLPVLGVDAGLEGVVGLAGDARYVTLPAGKNTVVARVDPRGGRIVRSRLLPGTLTIPAVAYDGSSGGLSGDGRTLVLIRPRLSFPRATTTLVALDAKRLVPRSEVKLRGDFSYDALSPDGAWLYLIQYVSPTDPTRYAVRVYDLEVGRLLAQPVTDPVESEHGEGKGEARHEHDVGRDLQCLVALAGHAPPTGCGRRDAKAEQAQEGFEDDRRRHEVCGLDDDRPERVGQDVPGQNLEVGGPDGAGRLYKLTLAESQRLSADQPSHPQPGRDRDREDDVLNAAPDQHHQDQGDEQVGHAVGDVDQRRYDHVDLASVEARQQAENNPDD